MYDARILLQQQHRAITHECAGVRDAGVRGAVYESWRSVREWFGSVTAEYECTHRHPAPIPKSARRGGVAPFFSSKNLWVSVIKQLCSWNILV